MSVTVDGSGLAAGPERRPALEGSTLGGRYQIKTVLGEGVSGVVASAHDLRAGHDVAIKILHARARGPDERDLGTELRIARRIRHANIIRVFDVMEVDGLDVLVMELARRGSLADEMARGGAPPSLGARIADGRMIAAGLAAIHEAGYVHRDVKPDNVVRLDDGTLAISDFGLAVEAAAAVGETMGTDGYMAPEIAEGKPATYASDVYALGGVLEQVLFRDDPTAPGTHAADDRRAAAERDLRRLCADCQAERPEDRPASAVVVVERLVAALRIARGEASKARDRRIATLVPLVAVAVVGAVVAMLRADWFRLGVAYPAIASTAAVGPPPNRDFVKLAGEPADWSDSRVLGDLPGAVHCLSALPGGKTLRAVWGEPRKAEDFDIGSGARRPADLLPRTHERGCPQPSPDGKSLLFEDTDEKGRSQVFLSRHTDGRDAEALTPGTMPAWLPPGDEFVYKADGNRAAAIFSLGTMRFNLLPQNSSDVPNGLDEVSPSPDGKLVALRFTGAGGASAIAVHEAPSWRIAGVYRFPRVPADLAWSRDGALAASYRDGENWSLVSLDRPGNAAVRRGTVAGADVRRVVPLLHGTALVARRLTSDVWLDEPDGSRRRLTADGRSWHPSLSARGDLLVQRDRGDGARVIALIPQGGGPERILTGGPFDDFPAFVPNSDNWIYVRFGPEATMSLCSLGSAGCQAIHTDKLIGHHAISPDGKRIALATYGGSGGPRLRLVSTDGGAAHDLGSTFLECAPRWSSPGRLWALRGSEGRKLWVELDAGGLTETGNRLPATDCHDVEPRPFEPARVSDRTETHSQILVRESAW